MAPKAGTRSVGRPRDPGHDDAILDATLRQIASEGYARMSLQRIAEEAGVSKASIYLRWPTKADLATAAMEHARLAEFPAATGDIRADLIAQLHWFQQTTERLSVMGLIGACLVEEGHTPELMQMLRERAGRPRLANLREVLQEAAERGEIDAEADIDEAARLLYGVFYAEYLPGPDLAADWADRAVDLVLRGLAP
jgi:AcrR family transcriptional regulator